MNRQNNKHFFDCWDQLKEIEEAKNYANPKALSELLAWEEAIFDEAGFYAGTEYPEAIRLYQERQNEIN